MKLNDWKVLQCSELKPEQVNKPNNGHTERGVLVVYAPWQGECCDEMNTKELVRDYGVTVAVCGEDEKTYVLEKSCECGGTMKQLPVEEWPANELAEIIGNILEDENRHRIVGIPFAMWQAMNSVGLEEEKNREVLLEMAAYWGIE